MTDGVRRELSTITPNAMNGEGTDIIRQRDPQPHALLHPPAAISSWDQKIANFYPGRLPRPPGTGAGTGPGGGPEDDTGSKLTENPQLAPLLLSMRGPPPSLPSLPPISTVPPSNQRHPTPPLRTGGPPSSSQHYTFQREGPGQGQDPYSRSQSHTPYSRGGDQDPRNRDRDRELEHDYYDRGPPTGNTLGGSDSHYRVTPSYEYPRQQHHLDDDGYDYSLQQLVNSSYSPPAHYEMIEEDSIPSWAS
jgi:hypothetical protein